MQTVTQYLRGIFFAAGLAMASTAAAQQAPEPLPAGDGAEVLSLEDMEALSGGTGFEIVVDTGQVLTATNTGNTVSGDVVGSGQVNIGSNAFSGYNGIGNFVINTGHNNNLQSSMNVSVVLAPPDPGS